MFEIGEVVSLTSGGYWGTDNVGTIMITPIQNGTRETYIVRVLNKLSGDYLLLSYFKHEISKYKGEC